MRAFLEFCSSCSGATPPSRRISLLLVPANEMAGAEVTRDAVRGSRGQLWRTVDRKVAKRASCLALQVLVPGARGADDGLQAAIAPDVVLVLVCSQEAPRGVFV